jgi:hypothetical protein
MKLEIIKDYHHRLVIGKEYLVPCFKTEKFIIPILLHLHDDKEWSR